MVPGAGIEPARPCEREILSLLCLPISPPGRMALHYQNNEAARSFAVRILTLLSRLRKKFY